MFTVSIIVIVFFLFNVGFIYEVTGDLPSSIPISGISRYDRMRLDIVSPVEKDVLGAKWLSTSTSPVSRFIYADRISISTVLTSYGMVPREQMSRLSNSTQPENGTYIYLRRFNVVHHLATSPYMRVDEPWDIRANLFNMTSKIYSNGCSEIWVKI